MVKKRQRLTIFYRSNEVVQCVSVGEGDHGNSAAHVPYNAGAVVIDLIIDRVPSGDKLFKGKCQLRVRTEVLIDLHRRKFAALKCLTFSAAEEKPRTAGLDLLCCAFAHLSPVRKGVVPTELEDDISKIEYGETWQVVVHALHANKATACGQAEPNNHVP